MTLSQLSPDARRDLAEIRLYLTQLPVQPAKKIIREIKAMLRRIAENPYIGHAHSDLTRIAGKEIRSRLCGAYRIYYRLGQSVPEVFAIRHTARDTRGILANRLQ